MTSSVSQVADSSLTVVIAVDDRDTSRLVEAELRGAGFSVLPVRDLAELNARISGAALIVADTRFAHGALADWLMLWPLPALILAHPEDSPDRLATLCSDESSAFLLCDADALWLRYVVVLLRKLRAIRESVDRQNIHVLRAESSYMNLMRMIPDIVYVLDGKGNFSYVNDAVRQLGFLPEDLIGRHFSVIIHPEDRAEVSRSDVLERYKGITTGPDQAPKLFDERRAGERLTRNLEVRLLRKNDDEWARANVCAWGEVSAKGVMLPDMGVERAGTIGIIHDVSQRRRLELDLNGKLESYSVMLKEIHHRVKNNLQIVSSLLSLQGSELDDYAAAIFENCQTQVQAMALVHEQVYRGNSLQGVQASAYLARLVEYLSLVYATAEKGIDIEVKAGECMLPLTKAIPLSLIVTELVTNACKHAFPEGQGGRITIQLQEFETEYCLTVRDNGAGFPTEAGEPGALEHCGIGMDIVHALVAQLRGEFNRYNDSGSVAKLHLPKDENS